MSSNDVQLTAVERARIAYERMTARQRDVAQVRRSRERSRTVKLVTVLVGALAMLIGTAIYNGWLPTTLRSSVLSFRADDGKFVETRTGQIRRFIKGNTCQELQFNNDRGVYVGGAYVPCQVESKREVPPPPPKGARVNSIRDAFSGR
jgi:hypothetical protein